MRLFSTLTEIRLTRAGPADTGPTGAAVLRALLFGAALVAASPAAYGQATDAGNQEDSRPAASDAEAANAPNALDVARFDPRADPAYGAYQRGLYLTAFRLALKRAEAGDPAAQTLIAELYDRGLGVARNRKEAAGWYGLAAEQDYAPAQFAYAVKLLAGDQIAQDRGKARDLFEKAAQAGHPVAQFNLAQMLVEERPGQAGLRAAMPLFEAAAAQGIADAYYAMALIREKGHDGSPPDLAEARQWMAKAARAGFDTAQVELAIWLSNGKGGPADPEAGFGWMGLAARSGNVIARNRLAKMYAMGVGTEPDAIEAAKWHILAQRAGLADPWLDDFLTRLDAASRQTALERANRWPTR